MGIVAGTGLDAAFAARSRDTVSHRSAGDGVDEGGLSATCTNKIQLPSTWDYQFFSTFVSSLFVQSIVLLIVG